MNKKKLVTTSLVGVISSIFGFLGIVSCCGFPLIAAFLAWFGIGASQLSFFSEYRFLFTGIAVLALAYGFYTIYFKNRKPSLSVNCCDIDSSNAEAQPCCAPSTKSKWFAKTLLWVALIAVAASFFLDPNNAETPAAESSCCAPIALEPVVDENASVSCCSQPELNKENAVTEKTSCCTSPESEQISAIKERRKKKQEELQSCCKK